MYHMVHPFQQILWKLSVCLESHCDVLGKGLTDLREKHLICVRILRTLAVGSLQNSRSHLISFCVSVHVRLLAKGGVHVNRGAVENLGKGRERI